MNIDIYPEKAQYICGDKIKIIVEINDKKNNTYINVNMNVSVYHNIIYKETKKIYKTQDNEIIEFCFSVPLTDWQGYGVDVCVADEDMNETEKSTAFDVVDKWNRAPRYGFLSDFYKEDENDIKDIKQMNKYHINVVQFYDWMYKHEDLIPKEEYYVDLLERKLSLKAVKDKIRFCHKYGMKAMAYGAIYASSKAFFHKHKKWALYDNMGNPQNLGNHFFIMNISEASPWTKHIVNEFKKAIEVLDFDGIHMDTYGFPKTAFSKLDGNEKLEKLNYQFPQIICKTRRVLSEVKENVGLIFNAVSSWGVEQVATAPQDAVYIEVWDPQEKYYHLYNLIVKAKQLSNKPVILAAYLKAFDPKLETEEVYKQNTFLLTSAVIFASGGYHLLLGEANGVLADPYYVNYGKISSEQFENEVRNYYDFIVRYANLLFEPDNVDVSMTYANGINMEYCFTNGKFSSYGEPNKVWTIVKEQPNYKIINLINLTGIYSDVWNEVKEKRPEMVENIGARALIDEKVKGVYLCSPDYNNGRSIKLEYSEEITDRGRAIKFVIPKLDVWDLVYIEVK